MLDRVEQQPRVGHLGQRAVEVLRPGKPFPEASAAVLRDKVPGRRSEQPPRAQVEVSQDPVGVEKEALRGSITWHQKRAGVSSTGIGVSR